jgi:two-component system, cell cycle response regulator
VLTSGTTTAREEHPQVLIAEDDAVVRLLLRHWLTTWGYDVVLAADGAEAWKILEQENSPKLIVLDWMMPGLDGIELCRRVRRKSTAYYQYILMVTGRSEMGHVVHALESGADDCIAKPFEESELKARLTVAKRILALQDELIEAREALRLQAMKDALTGLWNRSAFQEMFKHEMRRAERAGTDTGLLLLDLDHFKAINDTYGHMTGDIVLRETADRLLQNVRPYDFVGRFGGEEFLIGVPDCDAGHLRNHAERIRAAVAATPVQVGALEIPVTLSIGAAVAPTKSASAGTAMALADTAMYRAKRAGRNCVVYCVAPASAEKSNDDTPEARCAACASLLSGECVLIPPAGHVH